MTETVDVIIVGAGLSGLTAAHRLQAAERNVVVLEARDRPGGRLYGFKIGGRNIQLGGRWTGPGQDRVKSLAAEFGINTVTHGGFEDSASVIGGAGDYLVATACRIDALADTVPLTAPWSAPDARQLDGQTLATWLAANCAADLAAQIGATLSAFLPEPQDLSLLHALFYLKSNGGFAAILGLEGAPHDNEMFEGGAHALTDALYQSLESQVQLNTPIWKIAQDKGQVIVHTANSTMRAAQVIVTLPPVLAGRLQYDPPLPAARDYLTQRMPIRGKIAFALLYPEPFWRVGAGTMLVADEQILLWDEGGEQRPFALSGLVSIRRSRELSAMDLDTRKANVLAHAAAHFGDGALGASDYFEVDWAAEQWSRGCNSFMTTGVWTTWGHALREPIGRIHWAGAETSPYFVGQMEGAVQTAELVAERLLAE